jgi:hypothetical protein
MAEDKTSSDGIDYELEGSNKGEKGEGLRNDAGTDEGYDEAAHSGDSRYAVPEGEGGVFGVTGGGTYPGGFQVVERPGVYDRSGEPETKDEDRHTIQKDQAEGHERT